MTSEHVPVLIVGAGGAGLSLAVLLLQQGIEPLVVERRSGVSWYPRARNLNFRTMEVFRGVKLAGEVHRAGARVSRIVAREHLASQTQKELMDPASLLDTRSLSPEPFVWFCPQSRLEPILVAAVRERGGQVQYSTELVELTQDDRGVSATVREHGTGASRVIRAEFLAAADGAHSGIRQRLQIPTEGKGVLDEHYVFIYARAPWDRWVRDSETDTILVDNPDVRGIFMLAEKDLGMFVLTRKKTEGELSPDRARELLQKAIGQPDVPVEVVEVAPWQPEQRVAERFQHGRVFLVGDAAHTMPPKEGLGVNTAIQSAQNLAWKLAAVLSERAGEDLLSSYHTERHPVAMFAAQHSMTGPAAAVLEKTRMKEKASEFYPIVGYQYRSRAVLSDADQPSPRNEIVLLDREELTGVPGTRVPHLWLARGAERISTLDLLDGRFVLLTGTGQWSDAATDAAQKAGARLASYRIAPEGDLRPEDANWAAKLGISPDGAVLLRPDGFVAWHSPRGEANPAQVLLEVLTRILFRAGTPTIA